MLKIYKEKLFYVKFTNLSSLSQLSYSFAPGEDVGWQLCFVDGGGQFAEVRTREVLEDVLHVAIPDQQGCDILSHVSG